MADFDYVADIKKHSPDAADIDEEVVAGIIRHCGIALRSRDASLVSCSQKPELDRVRNSFLKKKLELDLPDEELDKAIKEVCEQMKASRNKSRVTFYYLLAEKFDKMELFIKKSVKNPD